jgi:hypothetical protein
MLKKGFLHPDKTMRYLKPKIVKKFRINHNKPPKATIDSINYYERSVFSQNGEDGILETYFQLLALVTSFL